MHIMSHGEIVVMETSAQDECLLLPRDMQSSTLCKIPHQDENHIKRGNLHESPEGWKKTKNENQINNCQNLGLLVVRLKSVGIICSDCLTRFISQINSRIISIQHHGGWQNDAVPSVTSRNVMDLGERGLNEFDTNLGLEVL